MSRSALYAALALLACGGPAAAATFPFATDPFEGTDALTTPGRQVVGGEASIAFDVAADVFALDPAFLGVTNPVRFANDLAENLSDVLNTVVLQTTDDDGNPGTPFGAGSAASLIAAQLTTPGPGFFVYFNSGLDLPRLVFSTDLSDETADLKILFRMTNLAGQSAALADFTAANFSFVPEPSSLALIAFGSALLATGPRRNSAPRSARGGSRKQRRRAR
jgi:hypothetical protein